MVTEDASSPAWHRSRLAEIDLHGDAQTKVRQGNVVPTPIVIRASAPGLPDATIEIPTSVNPSDGVMAVAAASAGKPVVIE